MEIQSLGLNYSHLAGDGGGGGGRFLHIPANIRFRFWVKYPSDARLIKNESS